MKAPAIPHELLGVISQAIDDAPWASADQADCEALEDEQVFRKRFGFIVNRGRRDKVLNLKHDADLTDREIRLLWWTYNLDLSSQEARITASNLTQAWGHVQMIALALLMVLGFWAAINSELRTLDRMIALIAIETALVTILFGVDYLYVRPNQIRRRIVCEKNAAMKGY